MVNLEGYRTLFVVATLVVALIVASPALALVVPFAGSSESFSEFWLLGPNHAAEHYPFNVSAGEMYSVFVGVGNHMGNSEYYKVYVKFRNINQSAPDSKKGVASSLSPLMEYQFFVGADEIWESPVNFGFGTITVEDFDNATVEDNVLSVSEVTVDEVTFPFNVSTAWDSEREGYFFQLFFELWRYDVGSSSFRFDGRFVGLWLNMTDSQPTEIM
jgi:uncharacterized membrane protein